ncbi:MAG: hypothetical protein ACM3YN_11060 [Parcubacteria group bacterium]
MLLSDRTKVVRAVLGFLAFCALVGFVMGLRSALPRGGDEDTTPQGPPAEATSNVVVEATPAQETPAPVTNEPAANEEAAANQDAKQAEEEAAATKAEQTKPVQPAPAAAPDEEAPSNDAIGQVLDQQPQQNAPAPPSLY